MIEQDGLTDDQWRDLSALLDADSFEELPEFDFESGVIRINHASHEVELKGQFLSESGLILRGRNSA